MMYGYKAMIGEFAGQVILSKDKKKKIKAIQINNYKRGLLADKKSIIPALYGVA